MIVKDLLQKKDEELVNMLRQVGNEPVPWTPVVLSELTRRSVVRLNKSSRHLERLTCWLIALTAVLFVVALPPAIETLERLLTVAPVSRPAPTEPGAAQSNTPKK